MILLSVILEFIVVFLFFDNISESKIKRTYAFIISFILYIIAYMVYTKIQFAFIILFVSFIVNFFIAWGVFRIPILYSLLSSAFLVSSLACCDTVAINLFYAIYGEFTAYCINDINFFISIFISGILFFILTRAAIYTGTFSPQEKKPPLFIFIYPLSASFCTWILRYISVQYILPRPLIYSIFIFSVLLLVSLILTFIFYGKSIKYSSEVYSLQRENDRIKTDETYYSLLAHQNDELKMLVHDEKNHLLAIKAIASNDEVSSYVDDIYKDIKYVSIFGGTDNKYLDLILNKYHILCKDKNIDFSFSVKTANLSFMTPKDLISMLGNIMDNAVEGAEKSEEKRIELTLNCVNGIDVLTVVNSCWRRPEALGKELLTSKKNRLIHGYGIKSIKKTAGKYGGETDWNYNETNNEFTFCAVFSN